jgi:hypothetical protein
MPKVALVPGDVAKVVLGLVRSDDLTGEVIVLDGGLGLLP